MKQFLGRLRLPMLLVALLAGFGVAGTAAAEEAGDSEARDRLADLLEDDEARERLIAELRRTEAAGAEQADEALEEEPALSLPRRIADTTQGIAEGFVSEFREAGAAIGGMRWGDTTAAFTALGPAVLDLGLVIAVTVGAFLLLRRLARPLFAGASRWAAGEGADARFLLIRRATAVVVAAVVDFVVIALAWVVGYALALFVLGDAGEMDTRHALFVNAFLVIEVFKSLIRVVFASKDDALRLLPMGAEEAAYWNAWLARLAGFIGYGLMVVTPIINLEIGTAPGRLVAVAIMGLAFLYALVIILQNRDRVRGRLEGMAETATYAFTGTLLRSLGRFWHVLAIAYFGALSLATLVRPEDALPFMVQATVQTLVAVGAGFFVSVLLTQIIGRRIRVPEETRERFPLLEDRLNGFVPTGLKVMRAVILVVVLALLLDAWAIFDLGVWMASEAGATTLGGFVSVALILLVAMGLWIGVASWIEHRLNPQTGHGEPGSRERTLLAIFRNAFAVVLVTITAMIVLSEIGINIGPLIAGAGVLGLAVGFGAQKLVQDVITGVFIQLENAVNVGDVVTAAGTTGTVEKLTIRSLGMRDLAGTFHMVPFSSVDSVANYMRGYAYHVGDYGVAYRENTDEVIVKLRDAFDELRADPENGHLIVGDLEVFGVTALGDSSVSVRVRIKTEPGSQWHIGRCYNRLVKRHLDAAGIEIPFPHMTLYFGQDKDGTAPPANLHVLENQPSGDGESGPVDPRRARSNPKWKQDFDDEG